MAYLRLYSRDIPIEQKRVIAQKLIETALHTLHLRPEERNRITVQFIPPPQASGVGGSPSAIPSGADCMLEVMAHHLTDAKKRAFGEEARTMLAHCCPRKRGRIAGLLGIKPDSPRRIALQFDELSPAITDPFVVEPDRRAA
jgi:hypothetical protein